MKTSLHYCSLLFLVLLLPAITGAQAIYTYTNAAGGVYNFLAPNLTATNITQVGSWGTNTPCTNGGGISGITVSPTYATYDPGNASSPALNVDVMPNAGFAINVTSITVSLRRSGTGPTQAMMAYSIDGGTTWIAKGTAESPNNAGCGSFTSHSWTFGSPVSVCGGLFKFRVYYYAPGASTGTIQFANLNINGSVSGGAGSVTHVKDTICANQLPFIWHGHSVSTGGTAVAADTFTNSHGCDSIVALDLKVNNPVETIIRDTICHSELPYTWNGITVMPAGNTAEEHLTVTGSNGCDSTAILRLYVSSPPVPVVYSVAPACGSVLFEGQTYTASTTFNDTVSTTYGCDSAYRTIHITVWPFPVVNLGNDTAICPQDTILLHAGNPGFHHLWSTGDTLASIPVNDSGTYSVTVTSQFGCNTTVDRHIAWLPAAVTEGFNFIPYFYDRLGTVAFSPLNPQNVISYLWDFGDGNTSTQRNPTHAFGSTGDYTITLKVFNTCGSMTYLQPINVDVATGIVSGARLAKEDIILYPNPSKETVTIACANSSSHIREIRVYSALGSLLYRRERITGASRQQVDVSAWTPGIYSMVIRTDAGQAVKKFEIVR
ncbi:T9SS type A sorting domain-containing protein [Taibaiella koreensis]|uniref:T9SS type A sorting domain-containing protein n=1 Tax=Taibaiella koreensis TaxID=1268548 RepID=UPI0013C32D8E|nr:T9SS type A sorting domain-containing protein [Taibaiella koreensis]